MTDFLREMLLWMLSPWGIFCIAILSMPLLDWMAGMPSPHDADEPHEIED